MPRIQASTVAEHRAQQHRAILDAARSLLAEGATEAPSLAAVATRTGLARSSVYQYFGSKEELLRAVIADAGPRWSAHVRARMDEATGPVERVLAYVEANVELVASGEHAVFRGLAAAMGGGDHSEQTAHADLAAESEDADDLHRQQARPLVSALEELGDPDPARTSELVQAVLFTATRNVEAGDEADAALDPVLRMLRPFLERLAVVEATEPVGAPS